ncbi:Pyruvate dehydrogenase E1 component subunit beta-3, chloroplastic [Zea mays]|uniref:pyruvate dehydrogenase (acetyl-transferring) n=1 Tax=Zea mays TaxID=4577 RepID=A0A317Y972_MAIZE|nr:Pyruvate dehydrogenase E1 component subunit beta-3, chloroplastic [Zea mays]
MAAAASSALHAVGAVASAKPRSVVPVNSEYCLIPSVSREQECYKSRTSMRCSIAFCIMLDYWSTRAFLIELKFYAVFLQANCVDKLCTRMWKHHELLMFEALREALIEEMNLDPTVCVMGEDVGHYGGSYKVTKGLAEMFGDLRVLDTPIAENSFTGMGVGAAMKGLRPVVEGMNMGFLLLAYNQISNNCGMLHYTSGGQFKIPVVIRGPGGVGRQLGAEHSQRLESYFQSIPGLQMVACSTPYNAKGLMKAAIRSENPVVLFEHVLLYNLKEKIPDEEYICCLEEAEMVRPGEHVTILTYSRMRYHVMQAAKTLVNKGYDPEVIDIRSLKPFDLHTIGNSIKKTHRVLIVEECMRTGGIGASLRSAIIDNFWDYLDAPIMCLSSQDVPTPYAATLEDATVVQPAQIVAAVEQICQ